MESRIAETGPEMCRFGLIRTVAFAAVALALAAAPQISFAQRGFHTGGGFHGPIYHGGFHAGYHSGFYGGHGGYWGHPAYGYGVSFRFGFGFGFGPFWGAYPYWFGYGPWWGPPAYYYPYAPYYFPAPNYPGSSPEYQNPGSQHQSAPPDSQNPDTDSAPPEPSSTPAPEELPDQDDVRIYSTAYNASVPSPHSSRHSGKKYQLTSYHNEHLLPQVSRSVQNAFQTLRAMPPWAQQRWLNSGRFTPQERKLLQTALHLPQEN